MKIRFLLLFTCVSGLVLSQQLTSSEIYSKMKQLNVLGKVLYLAAHPDDENTRFIAYSANSKMFETAYMSLTRGDGGQNLIGPELREELGLIRTQELIAARGVDGGQQFFSRANDFGYSKNPEETFAIWNKELVLGDLVYVIRSFRPDVIVCRFPSDGGGGHGHHTASAILGEEAFRLAANPKAYPEQLKEVQVWQATRIVTNTGRWWNPDISADDEGVVAENVGAYSALLGTSCNEIAAHSRTQHKSQGFGSTGARGEQMEYFEHVAGQPANESLFDGFESSWVRVQGGKQIQKAVDEMLTRFQVDAPQQSIPDLLKIRKMLTSMKQDEWVKLKTEQVNAIIVQCAGLFVEVETSSKYASPGDSVYAEFEVISRMADGFELLSISNLVFGVDIQGQNLKRNQVYEKRKGFVLPENLPLSTPYWLREKGTLGTYMLSDQNLVLKPDNGASVAFKVELKINQEPIELMVPLVNKSNDPVKGEVIQPFYVVPPASIRTKEPSYLVKNNEEQKVSYVVNAFSDGVEGSIRVRLPEGWELVSNSLSALILPKGAELSGELVVRPTASAQSGLLQLSLVGESTVNDASVTFIEYDHIPRQMMVRPAQAQLNPVDLKINSERIAYIPGAGDAVPEALMAMGYSVDVLDPDELSGLKAYDAVILGIRLLNVNERADVFMPQLLEYVSSGGTLIVQYNTRHRLKTDEIGPYPIKLSRDRVTNEQSSVKVLAPEHPVMNSPNTITQKDFENWVQERGLYFPGEWSDEYTPIIEWNDDGESPKQGALLVAEYGEGHYVYSGISFFRQLPAGVPGAYRLLANLIAL